MELLFVTAAVAFTAGYIARGEVGADDQRGTVERFLDEQRGEIQTAYAEGRLTHSAFVNRIAVIEDPDTVQIMQDAITVDGIGVDTGLEIARTFNANYDAYRDAERDDLERVNGVGENRATALLNH